MPNAWSEVQNIFEFTDDTEETQTKKLDIYRPISMFFGLYEREFNE